MLFALAAAELRAAENLVDTDFKALRALATPRAPSRGPQTALQQDADRRLQVAAFMTAADKARGFYEKNPAHVNATEARKIEVEALFGAVRAGAGEHEPKAVRLAREFRANQGNPSRERYQIAAMVREREVRQQNHGESKEDVLAAYERAAMDLYGEFPNEPGVYELFLGVARNADAPKAREVANRILLMPAPPAVKDEARAMIARLDMPGKPFVAEWTDDKGAPHAVSDYKGRVLVFYVWASWAGATDADRQVKAQMLPSAVLVSVNLDNDTALGKAARIRADLGGVAYYDNRGLDAPLARQLRANRVPGVYVVDRRGIFIGGGAPDTLAALLDSAAKQ